MTFFVGQKVVCIRGCGPNDPPPHTVKGAIYTVSEVFWDDEVMLQFVEARFDGLVSKGRRWSPGFCAHGYRPVVERKTDISIFTAMLDRAKDSAPA